MPDRWWSHEEKIGSRNDSGANMDSLRSREHSNYGYKTSKNKLQIHKTTNSSFLRYSTTLFTIPALVAEDSVENKGHVYREAVARSNTCCPIRSLLRLHIKIYLTAKKLGGKRARKNWRQQQKKKKNNKTEKKKEKGKKEQTNFLVWKQPRVI